MVLLYTGNELMAEITSENGSGNQNKAMPMQLRDSRGDGRGGWTKMKEKLHSSIKYSCMRHNPTAVSPDGQK